MTKMGKLNLFQTIIKRFSTMRAVACPSFKGNIKSSRRKMVSPESKTVSWSSLLDLSNESVNNGVSVNFTLSQKTFNKGFILIKDTVNSCCSLLFHLCQETFTKIWPFLQHFFNGLKHQSYFPAQNWNAPHRCWWRMLETKCVGDNFKMRF